MSSIATRWEPMWIGGSNHRLYAGLHPAGKGSTGVGVLVVPPLLHEQLRSRRLLTEVAGRLAAAGHACLRFDYFGSGDSDGSGDKMDLASMRENLEVAAQALRSKAGIKHLVVLGVRGGALPLASWLAHGGDAQTVLLWEPAVDGGELLAELERDDARELASTDRYPLRRGDPVERSEGQLMGFDISPNLRGDLAATRVSPEHWPRRPALWGILHPAAPPPGLRMQQVFELPADAPRIGGSPRMDGALFVSPGLQAVVDAVAQALQPDARRQLSRKVAGT